MFVTLAAAAGVPDIKRRLADGDDLGTDSTYRVYIDGVDQLDYWTGASPTSARDHILYYAETSLQAIRWRQWKLHFATRGGYYGATTQLELPWVFNVRLDPFESYEQAPGPRATTTQHKTSRLAMLRQAEGCTECRLRAGVSERLVRASS